MQDAHNVLCPDKKEMDDFVSGDRDKGDERQQLVVSP